MGIKTIIVSATAKMNYCTSGTIKIYFEYKYKRLASDGNVVIKP